MNGKHLLLILLLTFIVLPRGNTSDSLSYLNRILGMNEQNTDNNYKRLSVGTILLRDNPTNFALYELLEAHIRELDVMIRNNGDLISYYRTADGYMAGIIDLLQVIRELMLKGGNGVYSDDDREYINNEIHMYYDQIIYTLESAEFNTKKIFKELFTDKTFRERVKTGNENRLADIDELLIFFIRQRSLYGTKAGLLEFTNRGLGVTEENMNNVQSSLMDIDMAREIAGLKRNHLLVLINLLLLQK